MNDSQPFLIPLENLDLPGAVESYRREPNAGPALTIIVDIDTSHVIAMLDAHDLVMLHSREVLLDLPPYMPTITLTRPDLLDERALADLLATTLVRKSTAATHGGRFWVSLNQAPRSARKRR